MRCRIHVRGLSAAGAATFLRQVALASLWVASLFFGHSHGQDASRAGNGNQRTLSPRFVTDDAIVFAQLKPAAMLATAAAKYYPTEIIDAWCEENVGLLPEQVSGVRLVVPMPGPAGPMFGATFLFNEDVSPSQLNASIIDVSNTVNVGGLECYELEDPELVLHAASPRSWVIGTRNYVGKVVQSADRTDASATMPKLLSEVPAEGNLQVVIALEPLRPLLSSMVAQKAAELPPQFSRVARVRRAVRRGVVELRSVHHQHAQLLGLDFASQ